MGTAYLQCPECGEDAIPQDGYGCLGCEEAVEHSPCEPEAFWYEHDDAVCPLCSTPLRVSTDGERAWVDVRE